MASVKLAQGMAVLLALLLQPPLAAAQTAEATRDLAGDWHCAGHVSARGHPIAANLRFTRDSASGALIVRHDDEKPGPYHALELWYLGAAAGSRAASVDPYSGMRWFASMGWHGNAISWTRSQGFRPIERFVYTLTRPDRLRVDWLVARKNDALSLGDTLNCSKSVP